MVQHADIDHSGLTGVGGALTVENEGTPLATAATTLDFVGDQVTASGTGAEKTITIAHGSWTDFTPTIVGSVTNPTLGSSTLTGRYKLLDSKTMVFQMALTVTTGGAWNPGSGTWTFALPGGFTSAAYRQTCAIHVNDADGSRYTGTGVVGVSATTVGATAVWTASAGGNIAATVPVTWATGDYVLINGTIELT